MRKLITGLNKLGPNCFYFIVIKINFDEGLLKGP